MPVTLQGAEVPINSDDECEAHFGSENFVRDYMICVGGGSNGALSCNVSGKLCSD